MMNQNDFTLRLSDLRQEIEQVCRHCGRDPASVEILPVTKTHPAEVVRWAAEAGLTGVGENRVQEAQTKKADSGSCSTKLRWELIGHLQSNKIKSALQVFDRIQSVDSESLAAKLNRACAEACRVLPILLEFNTGNDPAKYGFRREEAPAVLKKIQSWPNLRVEGFMTLAPYTDDETILRPCFRALREIRQQAEDMYGHSFPVLSMGMSGDWRVAVEEGSTLIRPGTLLFGSRG
jgi:pyridoxal phosphate enzyme (YggS family)